MKKPVTDYRKLRLSNLNSPEFRHVKLLLYWPVYGLLFLFVEFYNDYYYSYHFLFLFLYKYIAYVILFLF